MTRRTRLAVVLLATIASVASPTQARQQTPVRDTRARATPGPAGTGAISGVVTSDDGSTPVRFAYVLLIGTGRGTVKVSSTDATGRFAFVDLAADRYLVAASKAPYLGTVAGAKRPARPGTAIALADGQKIEDVAVRMPRGAAIAGTIVDERGQPSAGTAVSLLQWRMQSGERTLAPAPGGGSTTDDQGRYRFFGLPPGEYVVVAQRYGAPLTAVPLTVGDVDRALRGQPVPVPQAPPLTRYAPVYFPGTTRADEAAPVPVAAGEERLDVNFQLAAVPTARVEGTVITSDGRPLARAGVMITSPVGSLLSTAMSVTVGPDGRFGASGVLPGTHWFTATGTGAQAGQFARTVVEVFGSDVVGVQLILRPAMTFSGRLVLDGASPPSVAGRRVPIEMLRSGSVAGAPLPAVTATDQAGAFKVTSLSPGRYVLGGPLSFGPTSDTMTWSLQSVVVDGRDVTDLPIDITDAPPRDVVVTYTDRFQELSGRLQSASGAPVADDTIVVFPEDQAYWIQGSRRVVTARPGTDGRFQLSGRGPATLPPARYLLAAVTDISRDEQFDPAFLASLVPGAVPITLQAGERRVQDLAIR
jgi:Carboxypeptidase regulatory-like domain